MNKEKTIEEILKSIFKLVSDAKKEINSITTKKDSYFDKDSMLPSNNPNWSNINSEEKKNTQPINKEKVHEQIKLYFKEELNNWIKKKLKNSFEKEFKIYSEKLIKDKLK